MAIVNFAIPKTLEKRVEKTMKDKGFASKAEFFRFAAVHFIDVMEKPLVSEDAQFTYLTEAVGKELAKQYRGKRLPSIKEQLTDL